MIERYREIQFQKAAGEREDGFTLIELLIVIVVLGILAAVVVFALGSVTSKSAVSACNADVKTVQTAIAAYNANNGTPLAKGSTGQTALTSSANGGPYLQSWPTNSASGSNYQITLDGTVANQVDVAIGTGSAAAYSATSCASAT
jgi:prepilin-type N-terminal cleavage/methylation domain-containing protein